MEINFHLNLGAVGRPPPAAKPAAREAVSADPPAETADTESAIAFENVRALNSALREVPASRADVVKRAADLIGDVNYPPRETIRQISSLLAMRLYADERAGADGSE